MKRIIFTLVFISSFLILAQNSNPYLKLNEYKAIADNFKEKGDSDSSLHYFLKAYQLAENLKDTLTLVVLKRNLGQIYEIKGFYTQSLHHYSNCISLCSRIGKKDEMAKCFLGLSNLDFRTGNNELALTNSIKAAEIFEEINDLPNLISANALKAQVYLGMKKFKESLLIYRNLLAQSIKINDSLNIVYNTEHIGDVYSFTKQYDSALFYMNKALKINKKLQNSIYQGIIYGNIGEVYLRLGDYKNAIKNLNIALEIEEKEDFKSGMIFVFYTLGETYSKMGDRRKAIDYFNKSSNLIEITGELREKPIVFKLLSEHYERTGDYQKAFSYLILFNNLNNSIIELSNQYRIEELKIRNNLDEAEKEYTKLLNEKQSKDIELSFSKNIIRLQFIIIILISLGLLALFYTTAFFLRSRKSLKEANQTKKMLFSIIGHDLKGPIGNIKKITDLLQLSDIEDQKSLIELLNQPVDSSLNLLEELIEWSKSSEKNMPLNKVSINLYDLVKNVLILLHPISSNKEIEIESKIRENTFVFADYNQLSTILRNLISNAIKYSYQKGKILIESQILKKYLKINIIDQGVGIDEITIQKILKSNSYFSTYGTGNEKGSGLGLSICKEFIKKNGGKFEVISNPGNGSNFSFTIPTN